MSELDRKVVAADVINAFMRGRWGDDFVLPNYTPYKWWECDVFLLRKSGRWIEHEVKLTLGDFRADAKKANAHHALQPGDGNGTKHVILAGEDRGPNHFFFITPWGMIQPADVPDWAGLIQFRLVDRARYGQESTGKFDICFSTLKEAPLRHVGKIAEGVRAHALGVCYWRYHHLRVKSDI